MSPDGEWIAWVSASEDDSIVHLTRIDGTAELGIPTGLVACADPVMTAHADGVLLAFTALPKRQAGYRLVFVADITERIWESG